MFTFLAIKSEPFLIMISELPCLGFLILGWNFENKLGEQTENNVIKILLVSDPHDLNRF